MLFVRVPPQEEDERDVVKGSNKPIRDAYLHSIEVVFADNPVPMLPLARVI